MIQRADLLCSIGWFRLQQGRYELIHGTGLESYECYRKQRGNDYTGTLSSLVLIALALQHQRQYKDSKKLHRRALRGNEKILKVEHPNILASVSNLAEAL